MDNIYNIVNVDPQTFASQEYSSQDTTLISSFTTSSIFNKAADYIEYFVLDLNKNILYPNQNYINYSINDTNVIIDPEKDIKELGFDSGQYYTLYNFLTKLLNSSADNKYYISEISSDRTEIRLDSNILDNAAIINGVNDYLAARVGLDYYPDFYLNFGNNQLIIANNILLDNTDPNNPTVLIKLYEPLPVEFDLKTELWVVEQLSEPLAYSIDIIVIFDANSNNINLKGPNFNISSKDVVNNSTDYYNLSQLNSTTSTTGSNSLLYRLNSVLTESGAEINIDYSDYNNFVHFSSATTRLENFYYKLSLIETYTSQSVSSSISTPNTYSSSSINIWQNKINDVITNFDGYEYYLYFESGSTTWPKSNSTPPYNNVNTLSTTGQNWLTAQLVTASTFDNDNDNNLIYSIPSYLREDPQNAPYQLFIEMIGQHFDNIWTYYKDVTNKYNADNRLDYGISKDLVAEAIRDFGVKLYQNNFSTNDLYSAFLGITPQGSLLPYTGSEVINTFITASSTGSLIPLDDVNKEIYKRIYHNLPYLLKKKGTVDGLRALINIYGIPDTILRISEFGGKKKINEAYDYWYDVFNYAWTPNQVNGTTGYYTSTNFIGSKFPGNPPPKTVEFRFKPAYGLQPASRQVLVSVSRTSTSHSFDITLEYTGSWKTSGSYSGSIVDPYYQYGTLKIISGSVSASAYLPFFDGGWWSVMATQDSSNNVTLYSKNKLYSNEGGPVIGFQASSSVAFDHIWTGSGTFLLNASVGNLNINGLSHTRFTGSYQELRFYTVPLSESTFNDFTLNPYSIEGNNNTDQSALNTLMFRAPLGSDLVTTFSNISAISSSHPAIRNYPVTNSFSNNTFTYAFAGGPTQYTFLPNTEVIAQDPFTSGVKNRVSNKINIKNAILPLTSSQSNIPNSNTLSPFISIQQNYAISNSFTTNLDYLEVAFSPQNEVNDDIVAQLGYFNIGNYIGDPTQLSQSLSYYPDLNALRDNYFLKYTLGNNSNYNLFDYIRLIKYFDNSLFKMIKDFTPARTDLASGVVIKQHILERNRYKLPPAYAEQPEYTGSVQSYAQGYYSGYSSSLTYPSPIELVNGGTGGTMFDLTDDFTFSNPRNPIMGLTQSWSESIQTLSGSTIIVHNTLDEFFNGEFSGSTVTVSKQSILDPDCEQYLHPDLTNTSWGPILYKAYTGSYSLGAAGIIDSSAVTFITNESAYLQSTNIPQPGSMSLWYNPGDPYLYYDPEIFDYNIGLTNIGIRYIKINNIDISGNDQSLRLRQATNIRINYKDVGSIDYPVIGIRKYSDHFLFTTQYINYTSSTDNEILNYYVSASVSSTSPDAWIGYPGNTVVNSLDTKVDPGNRFQITRGSYYLSNLPNINLIITASFKYDTTYATSATGSNITMNIIKSPNTAFSITSSTFPVGTTGILGNQTGTFTKSVMISSSFIEAGYYYGVQISNVPTAGGGINFACSLVTLQYTQSQAPQTITSDLFLISPQVSDLNFDNSDCNAIYGNESDYALSQYIEDVDYNTGITIPTNYNLIIQGTAAKSTAKDYYYNLRRQTIPRYEGSRSTATNINATATIYHGTLSGSKLVGNKISGSALANANLERYSQYFGVFNTVPSSSDLVGSDFNYYPNSVNVNINYLIDSSGNLIKVDNNAIDLAYLFKPQETASIILYNSGSDGQTFTSYINEAGIRNQFIFELNNGVENKFAFADLATAGVQITSYDYSSSDHPVLSQSSTNIFKFTTGSRPAGGSVEYLGKYFVNPTYSANYGDPSMESLIYTFTYSNGFDFYYKPTQQRITNSTSGIGTYAFKDTYLPLIPGDKIKITDLNSGSVAFYTSIINISNTSSTATTADIYITASSTPASNFTNTIGNKLSTFYRPYKSPSTLNIKKFINGGYDGLGIVLPADYNPTLNYTALLKKAGLL
jgi:hypothetical protein